MTAGDQNASPVVQHRTTLSDPFNETIADSLPRPAVLVAIPSTTAREDSVNDVLAENASRVHVQQMTDGWKEDAKGVLIFVSSVQLILTFHRSDFYFQRPASFPQLSHRLSLRAIKCCPPILETKSRFKLYPLSPPQSSLLT